MKTNHHAWILTFALGLLGCPGSDGGEDADTESAVSTGQADGTDATGAAPTTAADAATGGGACIPGAIESCTCDDGGEGSQACMPDGSEFFPCFCGGTDGGPDTTSGPPPATDDGGSTGGSGSDGMVGSLPVAGIQHPSSGEDRPVNQNIPFDGTGLDEEDGILMGPALVWSSDLEGEIGTGANIQVPLTMLGLHEITLTVTDSDGNVGTASIFLNIVP